MSTPIRENVATLIQQVEQGNLLGAFDTFYADNVSMRENTAAPTVGKTANRAREEQFVASVAEVHEVRAKRWLVDGDRAVIEWNLEYTAKDGTRIRLEQISAQTWENGKITDERFFYDTASVVVKN